MVLHTLLIHLASSISFFRISHLSRARFDSSLLRVCRPETVQNRLRALEPPSINNHPLVSNGPL